MQQQQRRRLFCTVFKDHAITCCFVRGEIGDRQIHRGEIEERSSQCQQSTTIFFTTTYSEQLYLATPSRYSVLVVGVVSTLQCIIHCEIEQEQLPADSRGYQGTFHTGEVRINVQNALISMSTLQQQPTGPRNFYHVSQQPTQDILRVSSINIRPTARYLQLES